MVERSCWQALLAVVMGAPLVVGCGSSSELVPVEGIVTLDGNPLPDAQVLFYQPDGGPETNFTDITDAGGRFTLTTLNNEETGVKPGKYVVNLRTGFAGPDLIETDPIPKELVPPKYQELEYEVPPEGDTEVKFELKSK